jgi:hypothetical protein
MIATAQKPEEMIDDLWTFEGKLGGFRCTVVDVPLSTFEADKLSIVKE